MSAGSCARIAISVVVLAATAVAAPKYTRTPSASAAPAMVAAEKLWASAAAQRDPKLASEAWDQAAAAFLAAAEGTTLSDAERKEAAYAAVLAVKNALAVDPRVATVAKTDTEWDTLPTPRPLPEREQRMVRTFDVYLKLDSTSDDAVGMKFLRANIWRRYDHYDLAIPAFVEILDKHRDHEVAEYAANLLLDAYNRLQRYDELVALADRLRADTAFIAKHPDLGELVRRIHAQSVAHGASKCSARASEQGDRAQHDRCGEMYLAIAADDPKAGDEALYNALVSFAEAGSLGRALDTAARLDERFPRSKLRPRASARRVALLAGVGRFAEAAAAAERLVAQFPEDRQVVDLALDAARWRLLLGEPDRAEALVAVLERTTIVRDRFRLVPIRMQLVAAQLAAGHRADALRLARMIRIVPHDLVELSPLAYANLLANAACPVELVDGLCPRRRDPQVMRLVRAALPQAPQPTGDDVALFQLDRELEDVLAHRRAAPRDRVEAGYRDLLRTSRADLRIAAHARLAALASDAKHEATARAEIEACIRDGRSEPAAETWVRICDRLRSAAKLPPIDPVAERLPALATAGFDPVAEGPATFGN